MNIKRYWVVILLTALALLIVPAWAGYAQEEPPPEDLTAEIQDINAIITPVMSYQGRLVEGGIPVSGSRSMTFRLFNASSGGTQVWQEGPKTITVSNGLFYTALGDTNPFTTAVLNLMDQNLWLQIIVEGVTLPRQRLMGAPYAFSLAPGADIEGSLGSGQSVLKAQNTGAGWGFLGQAVDGYGVYGTSTNSHGVYAHGSAGGLAGAALQAESVSGNGIAIWGLTNSDDTTLVASNDGAGPLFKGFGGDSGEHEFIILNDGTAQQDLTASGLVKAAVKANCGSSSSSIQYSFNNVGGTIVIANGAGAGECSLDMGFPVNERYLSVLAPSSVDRMATCYASTETGLSCFRFDAGGTGINGTIMILVY